MPGHVSEDLRVRSLKSQRDTCRPEKDPMKQQSKIIDGDGHIFGATEIV